jgi:REP element-mobilizing transposase RayT
MSEYLHKSHNVSVLLYHIVCPAKYRRVVITEEVDKTLKEVCEEISKRYEIQFLEIQTEGDHVHFLVQSVPMYSPTKIVTIKSIIARKVFVIHYLHDKLRTAFLQDIYRGNAKGVSHSCVSSSPSPEK